VIKRALLVEFISRSNAAAQDVQGSNFPEASKFATWPAMVIGVLNGRQPSALARDRGCMKPTKRRLRRSR